MLEYNCRTKFGFSRAEYLELTLREYAVFREMAEGEQAPQEEPLSFADDVL